MHVAAQNIKRKRASFILKSQRRCGCQADWEDERLGRRFGILVVVMDLCSDAEKLCVLAAFSCRE